MLAKEWPKGAC